jgi:hypothetical protein
MDIESQGQANARAQSHTGIVKCAKCKHRLVYVSFYSGDEGESVGFSAKVDGIPGSSISTTWPGKKGLQYSEEYYVHDGTKATRYRFVCKRSECRATSKGRGVVSYLDEDQLPEPGSVAFTRLTKAR